MSDYRKSLVKVYIVEPYRQAHDMIQKFMILEQDTFLNYAVNLACSWEISLRGVSYMLRWVFLYRA